MIKLGLMCLFSLTSPIFLRAVTLTTMTLVLTPFGSFMIVILGEFSSGNGSVTFVISTHPKLKTLDY